MAFALTGHVWSFGEFIDAALRGVCLGPKRLLPTHRLGFLFCGANRSRPRVLLLVTDAREVTGKLIWARTYKSNLIDVRYAPDSEAMRSGERPARG